MTEPANREAVDEAARQGKKAVRITGILLLVLGAIAIVVPILVALTVDLLLGVLLVVAGVAQGLHAFHVRGQVGAVGEILRAILYALAGLLLLIFPLAGIRALTLVLALLFVLVGATKVGMALRSRPRPGWAGLLAGGLATLLLAILVWAGWPSSAGWFIGILVGVQMLLAGWLSLALARSLGPRPDRTH